MDDRHRATYRRRMPTLVVTFVLLIASVATAPAASAAPRKYATRITVSRNKTGTVKPGTAVRLSATVESHGNARTGKITVTSTDGNGERTTRRLVLHAGKAVLTVKPTSTTRYVWSIGAGAAAKAATAKRTVTVSTYATSVVLATSPMSVVAGHSVTLTGTVRAHGKPWAGATVWLYQGAAHVKTAETNGNGVVKFTATPSSTTTYKLVAQKHLPDRSATSPAKTITVTRATSGPVIPALTATLSHSVFPAGTDDYGDVVVKATVSGHGFGISNGRFDLVSGGRVIATKVASLDPTYGDPVFEWTAKAEDGWDAIPISRTTAFSVVMHGTASYAAATSAPFTIAIDPTPQLTVTDVSAADSSGNVTVSGTSADLGSYYEIRVNGPDYDQHSLPYYTCFGDPGYGDIASTTVHPDGTWSVSLRAARSGYYAFALTWHNEGGGKCEPGYARVVSPVVGATPVTPSFAVGVDGMDPRSATTTCDPTWQSAELADGSAEITVASGEPITFLVGADNDFRNRGADNVADEIGGDVESSCSDWDGWLHSEDGESIDEWRQGFSGATYTITGPAGFSTAGSLTELQGDAAAFTPSVSGDYTLSVAASSDGVWAAGSRTLHVNLVS